jgi:hypothetical protein
MKTTTLVATIAAASALVFIRPVFAETYAGFPVMSADGQESSDSEESPMEPSFEEPWSDGQVLTPAPEQPAQPEPGSIYVAPPPVGLIDGIGHPPINTSFPELPPDSMGFANGGFHPKADSRAPQADSVAEPNDSVRSKSYRTPPAPIALASGTTKPIRRNAVSPPPTTMHR